jgi:Fur family transcriptional regulator, zinc uptake regulator
MIQSQKLGSNDETVLRLLKSASRPLSAYDILERLHGTKIKAAVQVYRATEKLASLGLVHRLESLNAFVACHCEHSASAPGFMLCTCCGDVREFDAGRTVSAAARDARGFRIDAPSVELKGLCSHCQTENHTHAEGGAK